MKKEKNVFSLHGGEYIPVIGFIPYMRRIRNYVKDIHDEIIETDENRLKFWRSATYHIGIFAVPIIGIGGEIIYKSLESLLK